MRFEALTPEKIEQAKKCKTADERMAFVKENGIELTGEQLEAVFQYGVPVTPRALEMTVREVAKFLTWTQRSLRPVSN